MERLNGYLSFHSELWREKGKEQSKSQSSVIAFFSHLHPFFLSFTASCKLKCSNGKRSLPPSPTSCPFVTTTSHWFSLLVSHCPSSMKSTNRLLSFIRIYRCLILGTFCVIVTIVEERVSELKKTRLQISDSPLTHPLPVWVTKVRAENCSYASSDGHLIKIKEFVVVVAFAEDEECVARHSNTLDEYNSWRYEKSDENDFVGTYQSNGWEVMDTSVLDHCLSANDIACRKYHLHSSSKKGIRRSWLKTSRKIGSAWPSFLPISRDSLSIGRVKSAQITQMKSD